MYTLIVIFTTFAGGTIEIHTDRIPSFEECMDTGTEIQMSTAIDRDVVESVVFTCTES